MAVGIGVVFVASRGDRRGVLIIGAVGTRGASCCGVAGVILGTLPGILFRVRHECVRGVNFKQRF